jgi:hypothetical protein
MAIHRGLFALSAVAAALLVADRAGAVGVYMNTTGNGNVVSCSSEGAPPGGSYNLSWACAIYDATDYPKTSWVRVDLDFYVGPDVKYVAGKICTDYYGYAGGCCGDIKEESGSGHVTVSPSLTCWSGDTYNYPYVWAEVHNPAVLKGIYTCTDTTCS